MPRKTALWLLAIGLLPGSALAYGEGGELEPSLQERALHLQTDRLRVDPGATDITFDSYPAVPPLVYNGDLHAAARFYADDIQENGCFPADHSSCDGTPFGDRVRSFYSGDAIGENIARGQPSAESAVFESWLYSDGHRENMLSPDWDEIGAGHADGGQPVWVQDFGARPGVPEPVITSGIHEPLWARAETDLTFRAAVHEPSGRDLAELHLVVTSVCTSMDIDRGGDGMTSYVATASTGPDGCMPYWFLGITEDGDAVAYPTEGSLLVPVGDAECATWTAARRGAECAPAGLGGFSGDGAGCSGGSGAEDTYPDANPDANVGENATYGTCALGAPRQPRAVWLLALLSVWGVRRRAR